ETRCEVLGGELSVWGQRVPLEPLERGARLVDPGRAGQEMAQRSRVHVRREVDGALERTRLAEVLYLVPGAQAVAEVERADVVRLVGQLGEAEMGMEGALEGAQERAQV